MEAGGNEVVDVNATYSATLFTDNGGVPGTKLGQLILPGTVQIMYIGRNPAINPLGTFDTELSAFDFSGMFAGNTFEIKKDPSMDSGGDTTILVNSTGPPVTYAVSGDINILAMYSFNGGPFTPAPARPGTLVPSAIPEPGLRVLAGILLAGMAGIASRRRRRV
jgi:hypothetical protein